MPRADTARLIDRPAAPVGAWVWPALVERDVVAAPGEVDGQQGPGQSGPGDADVSHGPGPTVGPQPEELERVAPEHPLLGSPAEPAGADHLAGVLLAEREGVVGAEEHRSSPMTSTR